MKYSWSALLCVISLGLMPGIVWGQEANADPPASATEPKFVDLPAAATKVEAGGRGRYLVLYLKDVRKLAIFDFVERKIVNYISVADDNVVFAANAEKLLVYQGTVQTMSRYNLATAEREATVPFEEKLVAMAMGHSSTDLLWAISRPSYDSEARLYDPRTFKPLAINVAGHRLLSTAPGAVLSGTVVRASADGKILAGTRTGLSPSGVYVNRVVGGTVTSQHEHKSFGVLNPAPDGKIYSFGGLLDRDLKTIGEPKGDIQEFPSLDNQFRMRLHRSGFYVEDRSERPAKISITTESDDRALWSIDGAILGLVNLNEHNYGFRYQEYDRRIFFHAEHRLLVVLGKGCQQLSLVELDIEKVLKESGIDYLFVVSRPPAQVAPGEMLRYTVQLRSKHADPEIKLESGPEGMKLKGSELTWKPPQSAAGLETILLSITDKTGQTIFHKFELLIGAAAQSAAAKPSLASSGAAAPSSDSPTHADLPASAVNVPEKFDQKSPQVVGLPAGTLYTATDPSSGGKVLLKGRRIAFFKPDGITLERQQDLGQNYRHLAVRQDYLLSTPEGKSEVHLIDRRNFQVQAKVPLPVGTVTSIAAHPTRPYCYVAQRIASGEIPSAFFVIVDETTKKAKQSRDFVGDQVAVDSTGRYLLATYSDHIRAGSQVVVNPDRVHFVPRYGSLECLIRYQLDRSGIPEFKEVESKPGSLQNGLRLSADGQQVATLPRLLHVKIWNATDFSEVPLTIPTISSVDYGGAQTAINDLAFHPRLKVAAVFTGNERNPALIRSDSGDALQGAVTPPRNAVSGGVPERLFFAPDGKGLILVTNAGGADFLVKAEVNLSAELQKELHVTSISAASPDTNARPASDANVPLKSLDALKGGPGKEMTSREISDWFTHSVVVVRIKNGSGTGFVVGAEGYILTCAHCVDEVGGTEVAYCAKVNGRAKEFSARAKVLHLDSKRDLALLKIAAGQPLRPVRFDSVESLAAGERVTVIANPGLGKSVLTHTLTEGVVSNAARHVDDQPMIQTTAAVNPGSSGGPMFNANGLVVGMVSMKGDIDAAGFAAPVRPLTQFLLEAASLNAEARQLARTWIDSSGKFNIDATYLDSSDESVQLNRAGKVISVPFARLSQGDRDFLQLLQAAQSSSESQP